MALSVPLSRSTLRVGGGSAFFVRRLRTIMSESDDIEVRRLCQALERLEKLTEPGSLEREALRKAGFALHLVFFDERRKEVERLYKNPPLTEAERARMISYGLDPDA